MIKNNSNWTLMDIIRHYEFNNNIFTYQKEEKLLINILDEIEESLNLVNSMRMYRLFLDKHANLNL